MTRNELNECMNRYIALWKQMIVSNDHRDHMIEIWIDRGFLDLDKSLFLKALYEYEDNAESPHFAPRPKQILDAYRVVKARQNHETTRRIVTPEEVMYQEYAKEMAKPPQKRNEEYIRRLLPGVEIFMNPEKYKEHYGAYREEFEKL